MIDLHIHSKFSDGDNTISEILEMASTLGISTLSITDHDKIDGIEEAIKLGKNYGINVIPGIEITAYDDEEVHILGYNFDYNLDVWKDYKKYNLDIHEKEKESIFKILNEHGISIEEKDIYKYSNGENVFKHAYVVRWLYNNGYGQSTKEVYNNFFLNGPLKNIKERRISVKNAIKIIHEANGIAILAHPGRFYNNSINEIKNKIIEYSKFGIDGVEAIYSTHSDELMDSLISFCEENRLKITFGSDFHGDISKYYIKLGTGVDNNLIKHQNKEDFIIKQLVK